MNDKEIPLSGIHPDQLDLLKQQLDSLNIDPNIDLSPYKYIFDDPNQSKKQTEAKHEIFINLTANVLENIEGESFPASKYVASNNYYIPVPSGHDHNEYLSAFFEYIENCISSSASSAEEKLNE
jgi:hypothetical protein